MDPVIIAVGSNLGDRLSYIQKAGVFLEKLSEGSIKKSSIWESEPVGGAKYQFLNCVAEITTSLSPLELLKEVKDFEQLCGREKNPERWGPRVLDLDVIAFGDLVIQQEGLIIPHAEYKNRSFVLLPLLEIDNEWQDPETETGIHKLVEEAPPMDIHRTDYEW